MQNDLIEMLEFKRLYRMQWQVERADQLAYHEYRAERAQLFSDISDVEEL